MARLNEPPAAGAVATATEDGTSQIPLETVESVKRRFIRQNRDLAKSNSAQSLRIRTLELEVSRLLEVNLNLQEQMISLRREVQDAKSRATKECLSGWKETIAEKMRELTALVENVNEDADIQQLPDESPDSKKSRYFQGMDFRERQSLSEIMRDNQMPTIVEHKSFPRQTLDAEEVKFLRLSGSSHTESPDLGPPPVARFADDGAINFEATPACEAIADAKTAPQQPIQLNEEDAIPASASVNVEARRRRKDGSSGLQIRRRSILPTQTIVEGDVTVHPLRAGAKRKLSDRDSEKSTKPPSRGDFNFVRKGAIEDPPSIERDQMDQAEHANSIVSSRSQSMGARKVLGDKSVNISPKKVRVTAGKGKKGDTKVPDVPQFEPKKSRSNDHKHRTASAKPLPKHNVSPDEIPVPPSADQQAQSAESAPMTPAPLDIFSPASSEVSGRPISNNDTPPPGDISTTSSSASMEGPRPSRRARAAVNYAEPSLVAKMRRPSKQMVDALGGLQDPRRAMNTSSEKTVSRESETTQHLHDRGDESTDDVPGPEAGQEALSRQSPLQDRASGTAENEPELSVEHKLHRQQLPMSSMTIATLIAGSRSKRSRQSEAHTMENECTSSDRLDELGIYDFNDSSSPSSPLGLDLKQATSSRTHRRHSSNPKNIPEKYPVPDRTVDLANGPTREARIVGRRRSMMV